MKKKKSLYYMLILSVLLFLMLIFIIININNNNKHVFKFPTNTGNASHYELKEEIELDDLNIKITGLKEIEKKEWLIEGEIDKKDIQLINDNYTFMLCNNNTVIQSSTSNIENLKNITIISDNKSEFNQIALIDNRTGEVLAVVDL